MSEVNRINVSALKTFESGFLNEKDNFNSSTYATFSNGYMQSCSDPVVTAMRTSLSSKYARISNAYSKILNWWNSYLENADGLENAIADNGRFGAISESLLRNTVMSMLNYLPDYKSDFTKIQYVNKSTFEFAMNSINEVGISSFGEIDNNSSPEMIAKGAQILSSGVTSISLEDYEYVLAYQKSQINEEIDSYNSLLDVLDKEISKYKETYEYASVQYEHIKSDLMSTYKTAQNLSYAQDVKANEFLSMFGLDDRTVLNQEKLIEQLSLYLSKEQVDEIVSSYTSLGDLQNKLRQNGVDTANITTVFEKSMVPFEDAFNYYVKNDANFKEFDNLIKQTTGFDTYLEFSEHYMNLQNMNMTVISTLYQAEQEKKMVKYTTYAITDEYQLFNDSAYNIDTNAVHNSESFNTYDYDHYILMCGNDNKVSPLQYVEYVLSIDPNANFKIEGYDSDKLKTILSMSERNVGTDTGAINIEKLFNFIYYNDSSETQKLVESLENEFNKYEGEVKAQAFLEHLTQENGKVTWDDVANHLLVTGKGLENGVEQWGSGIYYAFEQFKGENSSKIYSAEEYEAMFIMQALASQSDKIECGTVYIDEYGNKVSSSSIIDYTKDYTAGLSFNYQLNQSTGNMLPSIALSAAAAHYLGPLSITLGKVTVPINIGAISMGVSAGGNSYHNARVSGASSHDARIYGILSGISEAGLQYLIGGIPGLSKVDDTIKIPTNSASGMKTILSNAKSFLSNQFAEMREEAVQEFIDSFLRQSVLGEDVNWTDTGIQSMYAAVVAFFSSGEFNSVNAAVDHFKVNQTNSFISNNNISYDGLLAFLSEQNVMIESYILNNPNVSSEVLFKNLLESNPAVLNDIIKNLDSEIIDALKEEEISTNSNNETDTSKTSVKTNEFFKNIKNMTKEELYELWSSKTKEHAQLIDIQKTRDYQIYKNHLEQGHAVSYDETYHTLEKRISKLENEMDLIFQQYDTLENETATSETSVKTNEFADISTNSSYDNAINSENSLRQTIEVAIDDNTAKIFKIDNLINCVQDPEFVSKFEEFDNNTDLFNSGSKVEYAVAIRQLLDAAKKNNYDLGISENQVTIVKEKVNNIISVETNLDIINELGLSEISVSINDTTGKLMNVSELIDIIQDSDKFEKFIDFNNNLNMFKSGSKIEYTLAIEQLLEAAGKNNIDLGISESRINEIKNIIEYNFSNIAQNFDKKYKNSINVESFDDIINLQSTVDIANTKFIIDNKVYIINPDTGNICLMLENDVQASIYYNDPRQYIYTQLDNLTNQYKDNKLVTNMILYYRKMFSGYVNSISIDEICTDFLPYLNPEQKQIVSNLWQQSANNPLSKIADYISVYTKFAGPAIAAFQRKCSTVFADSVFDGKNTKKIAHYLKECVDECRELGYFDYSSEIYNSENIISDFINNISNGMTALTDNMIVYRRMNTSFLTGDSDIILPVGFRFTDAGFVSTTVSADKVKKHSYGGINSSILEIEVPEGVRAAYLETFSALRYNGQELLLEAGLTYEITGFIVDDITKEITYKVKVIPIENRVNPSDKVTVNEYEQVLNNTNISEKYNNALSDIDELYKNNDVSEHGVEHVKRVMQFALYLSDKLGLSESDKNLILDAAKYHDSALTQEVERNDRLAHGNLSASKSFDILNDKYNRDDLNILMAAIDYHALDDSTSNFKSICNYYNINTPEQVKRFEIISNVLKDADALDRARFPANLNPDYLRLNESKQLTDVATEIHENLATEEIRRNKQLNLYNPEQLVYIDRCQQINIPNTWINFVIKYKGKIRLAEILSAKIDRQLRTKI